MEQAECGAHTSGPLYTGGWGVNMGRSSQPVKLRYILCHNEKGNLSTLIIVLFNKKHFLMGFWGAHWIMVVKGGNMTNEVWFPWNFIFLHVSVWDFKALDEITSHVPTCTSLKIEVITDMKSKEKQSGTLLSTQTGLLVVRWGPGI
jgi:hypothetical protein